MKKLCVFITACFFGIATSAVVMANEDQLHGLSKDKSPHAQGGCASKGKVAQFHKFLPNSKGQQVKVPSSAAMESNKTSKTPSLDQFI